MTTALTAILKPIADRLYSMALPAPGRSLATRRTAEAIGAFVDRLYMGWEWFEAQSANYVATTEHGLTAG